MAEKKVNSRIQNKHDSSTNWGKAINFTPLEGEIIVYDDLNKIKIGKKDENGNLIPVNSLPFVSDVGTITHNKDFAKIVVNNTTIEADTERDTLTLVAGTNITITPDAANDKITIASSNPSLTKGTDTTASKTLAHGETFTAITDTDVNGHTITDTTTTYTLPAETILTVDQSTGTATTLAHNGTFTVITGVAKGDSGHNLDVVKTTFTLPSDIDTDNDKKTASENTSNKIFLVGATSQSTEGQVTYSHDTVYVNTDGHLYDTGSKVATEAMVNNLISCGMTDPTSDTTSQFYFKYN